MPREKWFGRYRVGWGWGPRTWQGWLIMLAVLAVIVLVPVLIQH